MNSFEESVAHVMHQKEDLERMLFDSFINGDFQPIGLIDEDLHFVSANVSFCRILDLPSNHNINHFHISTLPFSKNENFASLLNALIENTIPQFELETTFSTLTNKRKTLQLRMARIEEDGNFKGGILQLTDVTNYNQKVTLLENKLATLTAQNQQLQKYINNNLQLENFAYIASHDMKEPLRMIGNFSQLLAKRCKPQLTEEGNEYLTFILDGVRNMNSFVNDLLMYSQLDRKEQVIQETKTDILFYLLNREFEVELTDKNAEIVIESVPATIFCCKEKVKSLFQQLISNSLKFAKPDVPPKIIINGKEHEHFYEFKVTDNGIGLNEDFGEKIFMLFKKLHPKSKYPGTGIGLAMCKKIVEHHGGIISVQSELGIGTTINFTLNKV